MKIKTAAAGAKPGRSERSQLERELKKLEIRHLCDKDKPGYDEEAYHRKKIDLIIQLATLKASGTIKRNSDGQLIEVR